MFLERGIIHQHIQMAKLTDGCLHRLATKLRVGDIARNQKGSPTLFLHRIAGLFCVLILAQVHDRDIGAFPGIQDRNGTPDAGVPSGNQGYLAFQLARSPIAGCLVLRARVQIGFEPRLLEMLFRERWLRVSAGSGLNRFGLFGLRALRLLTLLFSLPLQLTLLTGRCTGRRCASPAGSAPAIAALLLVRHFQPPSTVSSWFRSATSSSTVRYERSLWADGWGVEVMHTTL